MAQYKSKSRRPFGFSTVSCCLLGFRKPPFHTELHKTWVQQCGRMARNTRHIAHPPRARHILYPPTRPSPDPRCFSTCVGDLGPSHPPRRATNVIVIVVVSTCLFMWFQGYMLASAKTTSHLSSVLVRYLTGHMQEIVERIASCAYLYLQESVGACVASCAYLYFSFSLSDMPRHSAPRALPICARNDTGRASGA